MATADKIGILKNKTITKKKTKKKKTITKKKVC